MQRMMFILKMSCMQANLNLFMRSGAHAAHDVYSENVLHAG
jgi:hypothetical protein